jgi:hypothetical protein
MGSEFQKEPRSRRPCLFCGHLYASHIDVCCIRVIEKEPRKECNCRGFVGTIAELQMAMNRQKNTQIQLDYKERLVAIQK